MNVFEEWTCVFPGKMGISWKRAWNGVGTKEEAESQADKNCNVVAVPLQLWEKMRDNEKRMVIAEGKFSFRELPPIVKKDLEKKGFEIREVTGLIKDCRAEWIVDCTKGTNNYVLTVSSCNTGWNIEVLQLFESFHIKHGTVGNLRQTTDAQNI